MTIKNILFYCILSQNKWLVTFSTCKAQYCTIKKKLYSEVFKSFLNLNLLLYEKYFLSVQHLDQRFPTWGLRFKWLQGKSEKQINLQVDLKNTFSLYIKKSFPSFFSLTLKLIASDSVLNLTQIGASLTHMPFDIRVRKQKAHSFYSTHCFCWYNDSATSRKSKDSCRFKMQNSILTAAAGETTRSVIPVIQIYDYVTLEFSVS